MRNHGHRVVITGAGAVTPLGLTLDKTWQGLIAGKSGIGAVTLFDPINIPPKIAGEVKKFDPQKYMDFKEVKRTTRMTQLAIAATREAIVQARLDLEKEDRTRVGTEIGTAVGGIETVLNEQKTLDTRGPRRLNPQVIPSFLINMPSCQVAIMFGLKGPAHSPVAACATGIYSLGDAARHLQYGEADVIIAGGTESIILPVAMAAFDRLTALSGRNDDPAGACRPFSLDRDGTVFGEGAAVFVLETLEHARARNATVLAEIAVMASLKMRSMWLHRTRKETGGARHEAGARGRGAGGRRGGLHQRARHGHTIKRPFGDAGHQTRVWRTRLPCPDQFHQVDDWAHIGCGRRDLDCGERQGDSGRYRAADDQSA